MDFHNEGLPDNLFELLNGRALHDKQHEAMMLLTTTQDLWPHTAMVSVGEVVAVDRTHLRLAMWPSTTTTQNLERTGQAMLVLFYGAKAYYLRLSVEALADHKAARHPRRRFSAKVDGVREDVAKYADITSGVQIQLKEPGDVLSRWQETIEDLLADD
ncbi:pyridoxamine 5'-phosphate oxidase family protein [Alicyclobacillus fastidiosus]|uniref:Pyridoxamine 5'-phosphate oxidase family protein n=1 Tax=Alicyclobacillus fastidiosus TaxID=392011 RepID=A0ABV5AC15_9BACL|nr:pyridoxamine 5'-phosphate oxidase family protein [Alicyclobacillus fastidiosus]WEH10312.1 pyridoxamine 5'-phosphate oxidase family protein [Alicyclobacillus fastidiosus]